MRSAFFRKGLILDYAYTGPVPNGSGPKMGPDRPSGYTGPFWNRYGTNPNGSKTGPAKQQVREFWNRLDPFRTGSKVFPCKHLDRFQTVQCKQKPIQGHVIELYKILFLSSFCITTATVTKTIINKKLMKSYIRRSAYSKH